jgi:hypothetical protein
MITQLKHLRKTYQQLRLIAGGTLIAAPLLIIATAYKLNIAILPTLSHYYFSEPQPGVIRTMFTGFLIIVGVILIAYRGFDGIDNWIHNAAGLFAIFVAFFPKKCDGDDLCCYQGLLSPLHMPSAILVFVAAVAAVVYGGGANLSERLEKEGLRKPRLARIISIALMSLGIVLYVKKNALMTHFQGFRSAVLLAELTGFYGFAIHWLAMTYVIDKANRRREKRRIAKSGELESAANVAPEKLRPAQAGPAVADSEELFDIP